MIREIERAVRKGYTVKFEDRRDIFFPGHVDMIVTVSNGRFSASTVIDPIVLNNSLENTNNMLVYDISELIDKVDTGVFIEDLLV